MHCWGASCIPLLVSFAWGHKLWRQPFILGWARWKPVGLPSLIMTQYGLPRGFKWKYRNCEGGRKAGDYLPNPKSFQLPRKQQHRHSLHNLKSTGESLPALMLFTVCMTLGAFSSLIKVINFLGLRSLSSPSKERMVWFRETSYTSLLKQTDQTVRSKC